MQESQKTKEALTEKELKALQAKANSATQDLDPNAYAYEEPITNINGAIIGKKTIYAGPNWDADLYNYGVKGMQGVTDPYWRSKNGLPKKLVDLELSHLRNIIAMVMRKDANYKNRLIFKQLLDEQKRREDTGELW